MIYVNTTLLVELLMYGIVYLDLLSLQILYFCKLFQK